MLAKAMVIAGGILTLGMALFHVTFPKLFDWKSDYAKIGAVRSRIPYTIHVALLLLFVGVGLLSLVYVNELSAPTGVGSGLMVVLALFWLWRTVWQVTYLRLPPGVKQSAWVVRHYVLTVVFALLALAYAYPVVASLR